MPINHHAVFLASKRTSRIAHCIPFPRGAAQQTFKKTSGPPELLTSESEKRAWPSADSTGRRWADIRVPSYDFPPILVPLLKSNSLQPSLPSITHYHHQAYFASSQTTIARSRCYSLAANPGLPSNVRPHPPSIGRSHPIPSPENTPDTTRGLSSTSCRQVRARQPLSHLRPRLCEIEAD